MKRSILFEAILVGLLNLLMFVIIRRLVPTISILYQIVITGICVHLFFEFSPFGNLNEMWCRTTFPLTTAKS